MIEKRKFNNKCHAIRISDRSDWIFANGDKVLVRKRDQDGHRVTFEYEGERYTRGPYEAKWPEFDMCSEEIPYTPPRRA